MQTIECSLRRRLLEELVLALSQLLEVWFHG